MTSRVDLIVEELLQDGPSSNDQNLKALLRCVSKSRGSAISKAEPIRCDLKRMFDPQTGWPSLLHTVAAMANVGGGVIVFGVEDDGHRIGLEQSLAGVLDPVQVGNRLKRHAPGANVPVEYHEMTFYGLRYGFLVVGEVRTLVVFDKEVGYNPRGGGAHVKVVQPGVLYVRGPGETRPATQGDMHAIVQRLVEAGSRSLLAKIESIAALPLGAGLAAFDPASPGVGVRLDAGGSGTPVRFVSDADAEAIPIAEVLSANVPFSSLEAEIASQVRTWRQGHPEHRVQAITLGAWYLERGGIAFDDDAAEFCLLSAGDGHGFAMFWASIMSDERLDQFFERELKEARYPMRQVLPYLVGAFRWSERRSLIRPSLDAMSGSRNVAERVMSARSFETFRRKARYGGTEFRVGPNEYSIDSLAKNQRSATQLFESMVSRAGQRSLSDGQRGIAHQLDILVHARDNTSPT